MGTNETLTEKSNESYLQQGIEGLLGSSALDNLHVIDRHIKAGWEQSDVYTFEQRELTGTFREDDLRIYPGSGRPHDFMVVVDVQSGDGSQESVQLNLGLQGVLFTVKPQN